MQVQIYTKGYCPYCDRAKEFFTQRGITFDEINIENDPEQYAELKARTHHMTVPQIFVDGNFVGGYTDMMAKIKHGELSFG